MRFLLDENTSKGLARFLTKAGHDVVRSVKVGLSGADDEELALWAKAHDCVLVTFDDDFLNDIVFPPEEYAGFIVVLISNRTPKRTIATVRLALAHLGDVSLAGALVVIEDEGVSIRPG